MTPQTSINLYILVISEEDLLAIKDGASFYEILEEKLDRIRYELYN
jgi:hypothetical protein